MTGDYDRSDVVAAITAQRGRTLELLETIDEAAWAIVVTPGWRVREVAAHLVATDEGALTGRMLRLGVRPVPVERLERWNDEQVARWADRPIPALLHGLDRWGRRVARMVATSPATLKIPGPFGPVTAPWLGMMRVYDEWIHGEDIRAAIGRPPDRDPQVVAPVIAHLPAVIVVQTLPELPGSAEGAVGIAATGPGADGEMWPFVVDMGSRRYGRDLEAATLVRAPAADLVLTAARRMAWRDLEAAGVLTIEGPRAPAEVFLDALIAV